MSYVILAIVSLVIGFGFGFLVFRNNSCKIIEIDKIIKEGDFSSATVQKIADVISGECKKDCGC